MVGVGDSSLQADLWAKLVGLVWGLTAAWCCICSSNIAVAVLICHTWLLV